jgi:hypothetical protein
VNCGARFGWLLVIARFHQLRHRPEARRHAYTHWRVLLGPGWYCRPEGRIGICTWSERQYESGPGADGQGGEPRAQLWYLEAAFAALWFSELEGGAAVGLEGGVITSFATNDWESDDLPLAGVNGPGFIGGFLRVTGGGGGFEVE